MPNGLILAGSHTTVSQAAPSLETLTNDQLSVSFMFGNPALNDLPGAANGH